MYEFSFLSSEDREELIRTRGVFLASRAEGDFLMDLYQMDSFYVEFFYLTHDHGVVKSRCFTSTEELKPYLGEISVEM